VDLIPQKETDFATREFESVSGTVGRVNQDLGGINELRSPNDQLPGIGRTAIENRISTLPGASGLVPVILSGRTDTSAAAEHLMEMVGQIMEVSEL
jgi:hypothetical protein